MEFGRKFETLIESSVNSIEDKEAKNVSANAAKKISEIFQVYNSDELFGSNPTIETKKFKEFLKSQFVFTRTKWLLILFDFQRKKRKKDDLEKINVMLGMINPDKNNPSGFFTAHSLIELNQKFSKPTK